MEHQPGKIEMGQGQPESGPQVSPRSRTVAAVLAFLVGWLGIHRLYVGRWGWGAVMLALSIAGFAVAFPVNNLGLLLVVPVWVWSMFDFAVIVLRRFRDKEGRLLLR